MTTQSPPTGAVSEDLVKQAAEAYIYGYPLVYNLNEIAKFPAGSPLLGGQAAPYNTFGRARKLLDHTAEFVSPNNDTMYLLAMCDVRHGPLVLHVPDTHGRYYVLQFVDAWSNNFAYIGHRATGTAAGDFLLTAAGAPPVDAPPGMRVVTAPTGLFAIVGRVAVSGPADVPAVHALQDQFSLTPLSVFQGGAELPAPAGVPQPDPGVSADLKWWEQFRVALAAFPPPAADAPFLALCAQFGLTAAASPYIDPDPALQRILATGQAAGQAKIEELIQKAAAPVNGWQSSKRLFNYNLDFFEIGALDAPEWKIADRPTAYVTRAVVARAGLWGNHGYEADYEQVYVDADNQPLNAAHRYELRLPEQPPVGAFWSLTMYNIPQFYLVENAINRYSIGSSHSGLKTEPDGSLTIYIQKDSPGPEKESNWLPTPQSGPFRPIMRLYEPHPSVLDGSFTLPAIQRVA